MNEKGYVTLVGLCMLIVVAFFIRGVQESERNYSYEAANFFAESELKNAADGALIEAAEKIRTDENEIKTKLKNGTTQTGDYQIQIINRSETSERLGKITVEVYAQHDNIEFYIREYKSSGNVSDKKFSEKPGFALISVAKCENKIIGGEMYQKSFAYIIEDDEEYIIQFANDN